MHVRRRGRGSMEEFEGKIRGGGVLTTTAICNGATQSARCCNIYKMGLSGEEIVQESYEYSGSVWIYGRL